MTQDNLLTLIISTKLIEKIAFGTLAANEATDLNHQLLTRYLNISKDTADRLKRSAQIFDFWKQILQNAHVKSNEQENFYKSLNIIIEAAPTSMIAQFTSLYYNAALIKDAENNPDININYTITDNKTNISKKNV